MIDNRGLTKRHVDCNCKGASDIETREEIPASLGEHQETG
jgi:hypothetical protein